MNQRKRRKSFFESFLVAVALLLAAQTLLSFPFEAFAKKTTTESSESIYLLDNKSDTSLTDKGVYGAKKEIELQREQTKSEDEKSSSSKDSDTKDSKESVEEEANKDGSKEKSSKNDVSLFAVSEATETNSGGLKYRVWPDGNAGVVGFSGSPFENITIPATISFQGTAYKVVDIYNGAFRNLSAVRTLTFASGSNIRLIYENAFRDCTNLSSIDLTNCNNLTIIQQEAFSGCRNLSTLKFPSNSKIHTIERNAFRNCDGLRNKKLVIPSSVRTIGEYAFVLDSYKYSELHHKKIASVNGELPDLTAPAVSLPDEATTYESKVNSSDEDEKTLLHKAAEWTNDKRTTAEIRLDYGKDFDRLAKADVILVLDCSGSMTLAATTKDDQNVTHNFPRAFLMNDIVYDATKMLVNTSRPGYDNRIALVGFEGSSTPKFRSNGFTNDLELVKEFLIKNQTYGQGQTNYSAGLQGAIDILNANASSDRIPVVIFLSDGGPTGGNTGLAQAEALRNRGVNVYPVGIYNTGFSTQDLKNISYDKKTVYNATDTEAFEKIMEEVLYDVINHSEPLDVQIEDVLSEEFELANGDDVQSNFDISSDGGQVSYDPNSRKITWDLTGCEQGVAHTLKIDVKVKEGTELTATGILDTNDSMGAVDGSIRSNEQPKLERYLAHYHFENANDPNVELPKEVKDLLPASSGGYGNHHNVVANEINPKEVKTADGRTWKFLGWDNDNKTINGQDVSFVGKWQFIGYDFSFIKFNDSGQVLEGAEFSLYAWKRTTDPTNSDLVNEASIAEGKWTLIDTQTSQANGRVDFYVPAEEGKYFQLVETKAPERYDKPQGQWRFTLDQNGYITNNTLNGIGGQNNTLPPPFELIEEGEFVGLLGVINKASAGYLPETGGLGQHMTFTLKAIGIWVVGMVLVGLYLYVNRRKEHSSSKTK